MPCKAGSELLVKMASQQVSCSGKDAWLFVIDLELNVRYARGVLEAAKERKASSGVILAGWLRC